MRRWHPVFALLLLGLTATVGWAQVARPDYQIQEFQAPEYQPVEGQQGKDVVWVPTKQGLVDMMLDMAKVTPEDYVIDLGSGDGRTVITAAKRGARALGIEFNPDLVKLSQKHAAESGVGDRATFIKADLFESDFSKATVVTMFLLPDLNLKLRPKLLAMKPGTRIVSNSFGMDEWEEDSRVTLSEDCFGWCTAYLWIVPAKVEGSWALDGGELVLQQVFQKIAGIIRRNGAEIHVHGKLDGENLSFDSGDAKYKGRVVGDTMSGTVSRNGVESPWTATRVKQSAAGIGW